MTEKAHHVLHAAFSLFDEGNDLAYNFQFLFFVVQHNSGCCYRYLWVTWSMCQSTCVGRDCEPCGKGWTDWDAIWGQTYICPRNHVLDWVVRTYGRHLANRVDWSMHGIYVGCRCHYCSQLLPTDLQTAFYCENVVMFVQYSWVRLLSRLPAVQLLFTSNAVNASASVSNGEEASGALSRTTRRWVGHHRPNNSGHRPRQAITSQGGRTATTEESSGIVLWKTENISNTR